MVKYNNVLEENLEFNMSKGIAQGAPTSSNFFNIYINEVNNNFQYVICR